MSAGGAAARLLALPADATATEVLCAALGCDRRGLASLPGGAARALASELGEACDREGPGARPACQRPASAQGPDGPRRGDVRAGRGGIPGARGGAAAREELIVRGEGEGRHTALRYDDATREAVAREVLAGASVSSVAREHGVSEGSVRSWARALEERLWEEDAARCRSEAAAEARRRAASAALLGSPGEVVLLEVETAAGPALVVADRGRDGLPSGTVRRVAGASLGQGPRALGRVRRRWACDGRALARAIAAALSNDPEARVTQAEAMRAMTGGAE